MDKHNDMNDSQKHVEEKKTEKRMPTVWFHLYEAKLMHGDKSQNSGSPPLGAYWWDRLVCKTLIFSA